MNQVDTPETYKGLARSLLDALEYVYDRRNHECSTLCATEPMCQWWVALSAIRRARSFERTAGDRE